MCASVQLGSAVGEALLREDYTVGDIYICNIHIHMDNSLSVAPTVDRQAEQTQQPGSAPLER